MLCIPEGTCMYICTTSLLKNFACANQRVKVCFIPTMYYLGVKSILLLWPNMQIRDNNYSANWKTLPKSLCHVS